MDVDDPISAGVVMKKGSDVKVKNGKICMERACEGRVTEKLILKFKKKRT
jgi:hypothetical protein